MRGNVLNVLVVNKYAYSGDGVNIMRGSIFGNPFRLQDGYSRESAIAAYKEWLREEYRRKGRVYDALIALTRRVLAGETVVLICCCKPKACHGDVIHAAIEALCAAMSAKNADRA